MSSALKELSPGVTRAEGVEPLFKRAGEGSLDEMLNAISVSLAARGEARCPVCGGTLGRSAAIEPAECADCGACLE
jgi:hypothetical protein